MRVCFDGLCFASKRPAVDEDIQTVLSCNQAHQNHLTHHQIIASEIISVPQNQNHPSKLIITNDNIKYHQQQQYQQQQNNKESSVIGSGIIVGDIKYRNKENGGGGCGEIYNKMENQNQSIMDIQNNQIVVNNSDFGNNNLMTTKSGIGNHDLNMLANVYISDNIINLTPKEQEFVRIIREKDQIIKELQDNLRRKNDEVAELKSHLDKFQSVFPFSSRSPARKTGTTNGQRQRAQGISAEPQSESSIMQMLSMRFQKYDKAER